MLRHSIGGTAITAGSESLPLKLKPMLRASVHNVFYSKICGIVLKIVFIVKRVLAVFSSYGYDTWGRMTHGDFAKVRLIVFGQEKKIQCFPLCAFL